MATCSAGRRTEGSLRVPKRLSATPHVATWPGTPTLTPLSTAVSKSSGFPRTVFVGTDRSNTGGGQDRPNTTGLDPNLPGDEQTIAHWFNTDAYVLNNVGTWGNTGRNTVIGRGITTLAASIIRNFRLTNSKTLQFRLEAFNALNNPIWNDPNTTLTSPLYGTINSTRKPMASVMRPARNNRRRRERGRASGITALMRAPLPSAGSSAAAA